MSTVANFGCMALVIVVHLSVERTFWHRCSLFRSILSKNVHSFGDTTKNGFSFIIYSLTDLLVRFAFASISLALAGDAVPSEQQLKWKAFGLFIQNESHFFLVIIIETVVFFRRFCYFSPINKYNFGLFYWNKWEIHLNFVLRKYIN